MLRLREPARQDGGKDNDGAPKMKSMKGMKGMKMKGM